MEESQKVSLPESIEFDPSRHGMEPSPDAVAGEEMERITAEALSLVTEAIKMREDHLGISRDN